MPGVGQQVPGESQPRQRLRRGPAWAVALAVVALAPPGRRTRPGRCPRLPHPGGGDRPGPGVPRHRHGRERLGNPIGERPRPGRIVGPDQRLRISPDSRGDGPDVPAGVKITPTGRVIITLNIGDDRFPDAGLPADLGYAEPSPAPRIREDSANAHTAPPRRKPRRAPPRAQRRQSWRFCDDKPAAQPPPPGQANPPGRRGAGVLFGGRWLGSPARDRRRRRLEAGILAVRPVGQPRPGGCARYTPGQDILNYVFAGQSLTGKRPPEP